MTAPGGAPAAGRRPPHEQQRIVRYFFFGALLLLLHQSGRMLLAFYVPLLAAGLLAMALYPVHTRLLRRMPGKLSLAAFVTTAGAALLIVLPLCGLGWVFFHEAIGLAPVARGWLEDAGDWRSRGLAAFAPLREGQLAVWLSAWRVDPQDILLRNLEALGGRVGVLAATMLRNVVMLFLDVVALVCLLFVLLRDGPEHLRTLLELVPLAGEHKETLRARISETVSGVVRGVVGVALVQGLLIGLGMAALGVPFPVLLGALTALVAQVPVVGTAIIIGPVVVCLYISGAAAEALQLAAWSVVVAVAVDNVLRPLWISSHTHQPFWLLLFGLLGGMELYGISGLLIGPVLVTVALSFANIYRREYASLLARGGISPHGDPPPRESGVSA